MSSSHRHRTAKGGFLTRLLPVLAVELAFAVDVNVAPGFSVLIGLYAAGLAFPFELCSVLELKGLADRRIVAVSFRGRVGALD